MITVKSAVDQYNALGGMAGFPGNSCQEFNDMESASFYALRRKVGSPIHALHLWECRNTGRCIIDKERNTIIVIHLH